MDDKNVNSCLMLAADLITPVSLSSIFDSGDLKDSGIEYDSHITIMYAGGKMLGKAELLGNIEKVDHTFITEFLKENSSEDLSDPYPVLEIFELGNFENDSGYVVLRLKQDAPMYDRLATLNKGLQEAYGVVSDFGSYKPHLTLAELEPGLTDKYLDDSKLHALLESSFVRFEDLILSYSEVGIKEYKVHNLTHYRAVDRWFRIRDLRREADEY